MAQARRDRVRAREILAAQVVAGLDRFDLALVLWAVRSRSRTRILHKLIRGPMTGPELISATTGYSSCVYRDLSELARSGLIQAQDAKRKGLGHRTKIYRIARTWPDKE